MCINSGLDRMNTFLFFHLSFLRSSLLLLTFSICHIAQPSSFFFFSTRHPSCTLSHTPFRDWKFRANHQRNISTKTKLKHDNTADIATMSKVEQVQDKDESKIIKTLEEDDEFEDFPDDAQWASKPANQLATLWEEDWDDDDSNDTFAQQLRDELRKNQKAV